jgi:hypothetical protein
VAYELLLVEALLHAAAVNGAAIRVHCNYRLDADVAARVQQYHSIGLNVHCTRMKAHQRRSTKQNTVAYELPPNESEILS